MYKFDFAHLAANQRLIFLIFHGSRKKAAPQPAAASAEPRAARTRTVLMAGNWKMNPVTVKEAKELAALLASAARTTAQVHS